MGFLRQPRDKRLAFIDEGLAYARRHGVEETAHLWRLMNVDASSLVETADGTIAAVVAAFDRGADRQAWVVVHPDFVGRGLGTALLERYIGHDRCFP